MIRLAALLCLLFSITFAQSAGEDVAAFVGRFAGMLPAPGVRLTVVARENSPTDREGMAQAIRAELDRRKVGVDAQMPAELRVTLSSQTGDALWVAEIVDGERRSAIVFRPMEPAVEGEATPPPIALISQPLFAQDSAILDVEEREGRLYVLSEDALSLYEGGPGQWRKLAGQDVAAEASRMPQGRIVLYDDRLEVYRPGKRCEGGRALDTALRCEAVQLWPIEGGTATMAEGMDTFLADRPGPNGTTVTEAFHDTTALGEEGRPPRVFAFADGMLGVVRSADTPVERYSGYGSQVAAIRPRCLGTPVLLASSEGDATQRDFVHALSATGKLNSIGSPLELPGWAVAMRTVEDGTRAVVIVRERSTNRYVALHISALCGS